MVQRVANAAGGSGGGGGGGVSGGGGGAGGGGSFCGGERAETPKDPAPRAPPRSALKGGREAAAASAAAAVTSSAAATASAAAATAAAAAAEAQASALTPAADVGGRDRAQSPPMPPHSAGSPGLFRRRPPLGAERRGVSAGGGVLGFRGNVGGDVVGGGSGRGGSESTSLAASASSWESAAAPLPPAASVSAPATPLDVPSREAAGESGSGGPGGRAVPIEASSSPAALTSSVAAAAAAAAAAASLAELVFVEKGEGVWFTEHVEVQCFDPLLPPLETCRKRKAFNLEAFLAMRPR